MPGDSFELLITSARSVAIEDEARARGIDVRGRSYAGPCPVCGGRDRFWIDIPRQAWGCRKHEPPAGGDVIALVQLLDDCSFTDAVRRLTNSEARPQVERAAPANADEAAAEQTRKARWLWDQRRAITGSIAERYLREVRGIEGVLPHTLAYLPPMREGHRPAMIARFGAPGEEISAVHFTFLREDGLAKAGIVDDNGHPRDKIVVGRTRAPIFIAVPEHETDEVDVTEGIEDALSVRRAGRGAVAAATAARLPHVADYISRRCRRATIWAHPDRDGARKAAELASRLHSMLIPTYVEGLGG